MTGEIAIAQQAGAFLFFRELGFLIGLALSFKTTEVKSER